MRRADFLHLLVHHREGEIRAIALAAQMPQIQVAQFGRHYLFGSVSGGFIGKVPVPAQDALFQTPWPMRTILQHFDVMIGFQHQGIGGADPLQDQFCGMTEVGKKTNVPARRSQ